MLLLFDFFKEQIPSTILSYTASGLLSSTQYTFSVIAVDSYNYSGPNNTFSVSTESSKVHASCFLELYSFSVVELFTNIISDGRKEEQREGAWCVRRCSYYSLIFATAKFRPLRNVIVGLILEFKPGPKCQNPVWPTCRD